MPDRRFLITILLALSLIASACSGQKPPTMPPGTVIPLTDLFTGKYSLTDHHGMPRTQADFIGKPALAYFGFTSCPDVCPAALGVLSATLNELGEEADVIQPLFIALDPERDTVEVVKTYLAFDDRILGLTGSPKAVTAAAGSFRVYAQRQELPDSALEYTLNHSSLFYVIDSQGTPVFAIKDTVSPQDLAAFLAYFSKKDT